MLQMHGWFGFFLTKKIYLDVFKSDSWGTANIYPYIAVSDIVRFSGKMKLKSPANILIFLLEYDENVS